VVSIVQDYFSAFSQTKLQSIFGGNAARFYSL
jgi:hypothetical protein